MSAPTFAGRTAARGIRWSLGAVVAKQGFQVLCAVVLARILGPSSYGVISAATVYIMFMSLLLDQGLSAALIQRESVARRTAGAAAGLNLLMAVALAGLTVAAAPHLAAFFRAAALEPVLLLLAAALPLKALSIVPRAMLSRELHFRGIGAADIAAAAAGAAAGISAALLGAGYFAIVPQILAADLLTAAILLGAARGPVPNLRLSEVRPLLAFSASVFATNWLAYFSRNMDNILVGRVLGVAALSFYSMAYRIMVIPVQLIGQTVNRVMFPAISRSAGDRSVVAGHLATTTRLLAMAVIPMMALVACTAHDLVLLVLGEAWLPAAPLMAVLAIGGARETVFYITPPLMKGLGRAGLNLRYELLAFALQVGGIVAGLQFGLLGVAVGLVAAGFLLTPVLLGIQKRLCGISVRTQLGNIWPPLHASLWAGGAYLGLLAVPAAPPAGAARLALGGAVFLLVLAAVLFLAHRRRLIEFLSLAQPLGSRRAQARSGRHVQTGADTTATPSHEPSNPAGAPAPANSDAPESNRAARSHS
ncbi:lipopolysaccharide biosynthesis protein [Zafaria cholistanensis]|uniref:Lipopolysaccharide biosynthesis protein n=1 Tax=Zafaria cholistanensis TaxID=1682741 RepID=A0A5A7NP28_9MICC|nr:lipopolysaccharide biosynthesis protein [Zafaria cholistanensis]GER22673.1 lipopolysaccharide biosynthesis protein [Zafaria cholistanensis]